MMPLSHVSLKPKTKEKFYNFVQDSFNILTGTLVWVSFLIPVLILPIWLPLGILRLFIHFLARVFKPKLIPITKPMDSLFILKPSEKFPQMSGSQVWKIKGKLDAPNFRKHFYNVLLSTGELRQKHLNLYCYYVQWFLYCFKKRVDKLNLEECIKEHHLTTEETLNLNEFIGKWLFTNDYEANKPNWKILICYCEKGQSSRRGKGIHKGVGETETVLLFKMDHGLADGYTLIHLINKLTGIEAPYIVKEKGVSIWTKLKFILSAAWTLVVRLPVQLIFTKELPLIRKEWTETAGGIPKKKPEWLVSFNTFDINKIKQVRRATESHFNTVVGMLHVGALRRHMIKTKKIKSEEELPDFTWVSSPAAMPNHPAMLHGTMTNHLTLTTWKIPIRSNKQASERLLSAENDYLSWEKLGLPEIFSWIVTPIVWTMPPQMAMWFMRTVQSLRMTPVPHCLSPLMLSTQPYKLMGHSVNHIYLPVYIPTFIPAVKMYVVPVSNSGQLDLSVNSTSDIFESQAELDNFTQVLMEEELEDLVQSCKAFLSTVDL